MDEQQKDDQHTPVTSPLPTTIIAPADTPTPPPAPLETPQDAEVLPQTPATPLAASDTTTPQSSFVQSAESSPSNDSAQSISWTASEFHVHQKSVAWYCTLAVATVVLAAILYFLTKSIVTPVVVIICGIVLGVYGGRRPGNLEYTVNGHGVHIGSKHYTYDEFRLFVVTPALSTPEVLLMPTKRFMPPLSIRYAPDIENKVLNLLAEHLPFEERRPDLIDSLMHQLHF
jgi:hypothetical protein